MEGAGHAGIFGAEVTFGEPRVYPDRRTAADATHDEVAGMRAEKQLSAVEPSAFSRFSGRNLTTDNHEL